MFFESVHQHAHLEVPELDAPRVERRREEGESGMEGDPLDPVRLGLELRERAQLPHSPWHSALTLVSICILGQTTRTERQE